MRRLAPALLLVLLTGCAARYPGYVGNGWDGRRGYDGNGDYGYDLNASRAEARNYRARASRSYPAPGTPDDPWGPYVQEAASRYAVPERWIREVMRQESGGRLQRSDGSLTTSAVGAMGLMQVMPATYDTLRARYGLGDDPYEPHDNIMAGAAYIREMYDRFGAPAFLAAYNAGPNRVDSYLAGSSELPDETVNYLARVAPRLGNAVAMSGPLAVYAGSAGNAYAAARLPPRRGNPGSGSAADAAYMGGGMLPEDAAYAGGGLTGTEYAAGSTGQPAGSPMETSADAADQAFDGGGLVSGAAPFGDRAGQGLSESQPVEVASAAGAAPAAWEVASAAPAAPPAPMGRTFAPGRPAMPIPRLVSAASAAPVARGGWGVQVGAYPDPSISRAAVAAARSRAGGALDAAEAAVTPVQHGGTLFRARLVGLSAVSAGAACATLSRGGMPCFTVPPGS